MQGCPNLGHGGDVAVGWCWGPTLPCFAPSPASSALGPADMGILETPRKLHSLVPPFPLG